MGALVRLGTRLRNRIHAVCADHGYHRPDRTWTGAYWTGPGRQWLDALDLPEVPRQITWDSLGIIDAIAPTIDRLDREIHARANADPRVKVLTALPGVGEFTALVLLAEIGDITRFGNARKLASWAGLTPMVRGSDLTVRHGHISKQGSPYVRWVLGQSCLPARYSSRTTATRASGPATVAAVKCDRRRRPAGCPVRRKGGDPRPIPCGS